MREESQRGRTGGRHLQTEPKDCWLHLCHRYVMTHLSALSRPHGWMAVRKSRVSLSPGHLAGRRSHIPICPCSRAAPHPCTLTQPHSSGSTALGQDWWDPCCPTTSPDHKVTTSTPNRQSQIVAKIYTFLKNKKLLFNVYSSCPGWLY